MRPPTYTAGDLRAWRRLTGAVRQVNLQVERWGEARGAALRELKQAAHAAGKAVYPAQDERDRARLMAFWKLVGGYVIVTPQARLGMNAALQRGLGVALAIIGGSEDPPPRAVAARMPYKDA